MRPLPEPRTSPLRCAAYDTDNEVIVVFGGEGNSEGTVVYDPYTNAWTRMQPPKQPAFRSGGNMAYDEANKQFILFGSQFSDDPHTWAYSLTDNRWTDLNPATQPPTDKNDAVLTYDPLNKVVIAVVRVREGKSDEKAHLETWAFDPAKRTWTKMNPPREPTPSGNRARLMTFLPDHGVALLENRTPSEQQVWTYRYASPAVDHDPPAPTGLTLSAGKKSVTLAWKPSASKSVARYVIYRGEGEQPWKADLRRVGVVKAGELKFVDHTVKPGVVYHYAVAAEDAKGRAGARSRRARSQPGLVEDVIASVKSAKEVALSWKAAEGAVGYHVERAPVEVWTEDELKVEKKHTPPLKEPSVAAIRRIGAFEPETKCFVTEPSLTDELDLGKPVKIEGKPLWERRRGKEEIEKGKPYRFAVYAYRVRAVNALGVKGGLSPYVLTIPSAPQQVVSRERGQACDLKWAKSPEDGLKGYRVYRLDGRWGNQPVSRLTAEPIEKTAFTDEKAGRASRRYHVVAVDAIGQEGIPSAPVWFEREWKPYYKPFVGEWHQ
jgi:fibronectin type 3 domain-containing protein